ncbi:MAG: ATP-binding protein [Bacillota bacterium]
MRKNLMSRLMAANLLVIGVTVLALGFVFLGLLRQYIYSSREADLIAKGQEVSRLTLDYLRGEVDEETATYLLDSLDRILGARVWLVNRRGLIVIESRQGHFRGTHLDPEDLRQVMNGEPISRIHMMPRYGRQVMTVAVPVVDPEGGEVLGALFLHAPLTGLHATVARYFGFLLLAAAASLGLATILGYGLARGIARPLSDMTRAAGKMAQGELDTRVRVPGGDEVGELAKSLNHLATSLQGTIGALTEEKARFLSMVASMEEGVVGFDPRGNPVFLNDAARRLLGFSQAPPEVITLVQDVLATGEPAGISLDIRARRLRAQASPIRVAGGGAVVVLLDVSEADRLERMRREFTANLSHELRTPLTAMRGFIEPLLDGTVTGEDTRRRYLEIIRAETERLGRLVNDMLDMARLEAGKAQLDIASFSLASVAGSALAKVSPGASEKGVRLEGGVPGVDVMGDRDRIEQVLLNLLDNAVRYTARGGRVTLDAEVSESSVTVTVTDTGVGIAPEEIPLLWDRFYKADRSRGKKAGTGLGLAIVRQIVEAHGERVWVESEPGRGSIFAFTLARAPWDPAKSGP